MPDDSPWRTAASHELLRTDPFHVNVSVCALVTPLLVPLICPVALWLKGTSASLPPLPIEPASVRLSVPDVSVPPVWLPVVAPVSALPSQPEASEMRLRSPVRRESMVRKYAPGAVTLNDMLCCAFPLVSWVLKTPVSALMFHA